MQKIIFGCITAILTIAPSNASGQTSIDFRRLSDRVENIEVRIHRQNMKIDEMNENINVLIGYVKKLSGSDEGFRSSSKQQFKLLTVRLRHLESGFEELHTENLKLMNENSELQKRIKDLAKRSRAVPETRPANLRHRSNEPVPENVRPASSRTYEEFHRRNKRGIVVGPPPGSGSAILIPNFCDR